tara:strand:+ start:884 stop:1162 length:279 start_codon:yes stop_codon:yes gene_type:complete
MTFIRAIQQYNESNDNWETIQSGSTTVLKRETTSTVATDDPAIELINGSYYNGVYYEEGDYFIADYDYNYSTGWIWPSDLKWDSNWASRQSP